MGGQDDGGILVVVLDDGVEDVVAGCGVHAADRFIEQVEFRVAAHDEDELDLLAGTFGQRLELCLRVDVEVGEHLAGLVHVEVFVKVLHELQHLFDRHAVLEVVAFREIGDDALRFHTGLHAVDEDLAGGRLQQTAGQFDECGLSGAVGTEEPDDLAGGQFEVDPVQGLEAAILLDKLSAFQNGCHKQCLLKTVY